MAIERTTIHNHYVFRDDSNTFRWYDAQGPSAHKYLQDFTSLPVDDTTGDPTEFVNTVVEAGAGGDSTATLTDAAGGALLITTDNAEDDGYKMQLGDAGGGEWVDFSGDYPAYFGIRFKVNDVDQTDCLFGVAVTDTAVLDAVADGLYFRSVDGSAVLNLVAEKDSTESSLAATTLSDDTYVIAEFYYDGTSAVTAYIDGSSVGTIALSDANFPDNEYMRLTIEFLTGETTANTCTIDWVRLIQIHA
ncbi:MAG: hypothetical protein GF364_22720 [Candidatus Lokiarchaeota archaeon]|nr:hypothetical protein [Candidatus Lokiarchaeota archaeon]